MRLLFLTFATLILSTSAALASHQIDIKVNGMICDFCAQAIWKVFEDYEAVENVNIDLDTGTVSVMLKEGQDLTDEQLDTAIQYSGYDLVEIKRHDG